MSTRPNSLRKMFVLTPLLLLQRVSRKWSWWGGDIDSNCYFHTHFLFIFDSSNCRKENAVGIGFERLLIWRCFYCYTYVTVFKCKHTNVFIFSLFAIALSSSFCSSLSHSTLIRYPLTRTFSLKLDLISGKNESRPKSRTFFVAASISLLCHN